MRRKTHEEFLDSVDGMPFIVQGRYAGNKKPISVKCAVDGHVWLASPSNLLSGKGCPVCGRMRTVASRRGTNTVVSDIGSWIILDVSTPSKPSQLCKIDKHDAAMFKGRLYVGSTGYAEVCINSKLEKVHRVLLGVSDNTQIDHINRDRLDNRRVNLRKCTVSDNAKNHSISTRNTSGTVGVNFDRRSGKWRSRIRSNGIAIELGYFKDKQDAVRVRKEAEKRYFGEFAPKF